MYRSWAKGNFNFQMVIKKKEYVTETDVAYKAKIIYYLVPHTKKKKKIANLYSKGL